jgi:deoxycytidylate deaminase
MEIKKEIKYPYLPDEGSFEYVSEDNLFMQAAKEQARKSNDQQQPAGSVVVDGGIIVDGDSNKNPLSKNWAIKLHKKYCIRHILHIPSGQKYWMCLGCASNSTHSESRLVEKIQKSQIKLNNPELYLWGHWWCCEPCWNKMLQIGIKKVYLLEKSEILFNPRILGNIIGHQFK